MPTFPFDHSRQKGLQSPKVCEGIHAESPVCLFERTECGSSCGSFILIYVPGIEVKDQLPLDHASVVHKNSRVANLGIAVSLEVYDTTSVY